MGRGNFEAKEAAHCKVLGHSVVICAKTPEPMVMLFGFWARTGPRNHKLDGVQIPHGKGQFWGKVQGLSAVSCAKTAEPIDLPFGFGLWWAQ